MAILLSVIAKQARPFGDHLSLKKRLQFCNLLLLKSDDFWRYPIAEKQWQFCDILLLNKQCCLAITYR
jgi:hypothetical protein